MNESSYSPRTKPGGTRVVSLASGSSGNCLLIESGSTRCLVDCGIAPTALRKQLCLLGLEIRDLSFVFITHEHIDHIRALKSIARAGVEIVTSKGTAGALGLERRHWTQALNDRRFASGSIEAVPVTVSHDASEPLGILVWAGNHSIAVFTDLGHWDDRIVDTMAAANTVVVEANHNLEMLRHGPYPAHLKRRVLSRLGHLSNEDCGTLTERVVSRSGACPRIFLAHLSVTNNSPEQAIRDVARTGGWHGDHLTALPRQTVLDLTGVSPAVRRVPAMTQGSFWSDTLGTNPSGE